MVLSASLSKGPLVSMVDGCDVQLFQIMSQIPRSKTGTPKQPLYHHAFISSVSTYFLNTEVRKAWILGSDCLISNPASFIYYLCNFEQVFISLHASVSSFVK